MSETPNQPVPGNPAAHWGTTDPESQPSRDQVMGLPRLVIETRARLGPTATPEQVLADLKARDIDTTLEEVRSLWS